MIHVNNDVKKAYMDGNAHKFYSIDLLDERNNVLKSIRNENLVSESCVFDERFCSTDVIKFGCIESNYFEFQCFNTEENNLDLESLNPLGKRIKVTHFIETSEGRYGNVAIGLFKIQDVSIQSTNHIYKIKAYSVVNNLDVNIKDFLADIRTNYCENYNVADGISVFFAKQTALRKYGIVTKGNEIEKSVSNVGLVYDHENDIEYEITKRPWNTNKYRLVVHQRTYYVGVNGASNGDYVRLYTRLNFLGSAIRSLVSRFWEELQNNQNLDDGGCLHFKRDLFNEAYIPMNDILNKELLSFPYTATSTGVTFGDIYNAQEMMRGSLSVKVYDGSNYKRFYDKIGLEADPFEKYYSCYHKKEHSYFLEIPYGFDVYDDNGKMIEVYSSSLDNAIDLITDSYYAQIVTPSEVETYKYIASDDETLRSIISNVAELNCWTPKFGRTSSEVLFMDESYDYYPEMKYPANTLYPSATNYPKVDLESMHNSLVSRLWYEPYGIHKFRNLIINTSAGSTSYQKTFVVNEDGTDDYVVADSNIVYHSYVDSIGETMVQKMKDYTWFPFEADLLGFPYVEAGDVIEVETDNGTYRTNLLRRTMRGIQSLSDNYINGKLNIF